MITGFNVEITGTRKIDSVHITAAGKYHVLAYLDQTDTLLDILESSLHLFDPIHPIDISIKPIK
jgi:hypothetical protein